MFVDFYGLITRRQALVHEELLLGFRSSLFVNEDRTTNNEQQFLRDRLPAGRISVG